MPAEQAGSSEQQVRRAVPACQADKADIAEQAGMAVPADTGKAVQADTAVPAGTDKAVQAVQAGQVEQAELPAQVQGPVRAQG